MFRLLKYQYPQVSQIQSTLRNFTKTNYFFSFNKKDFFKKTNLLLAKDYYSKKFI